MKDTGLSPDQIERMRSVFRGVPAISEVVLYGSRAKGTHRPGSDIDLALVGLDDLVQAEAVAEELDELPTPYRFDVKAYGSIADGPLREHIARVGVSLYRRDPPHQTEAEKLDAAMGSWTARDQPWSTRAGTGACPVGCFRDRIRLRRPFVAVQSRLEL